MTVPWTGQPWEPIPALLVEIGHTCPEGDCPDEGCSAVQAEAQYRDMIEHMADERTRLDAAMAAIMRLGHTAHCAHRLAFGDGECECIGRPCGQVSPEGNRCEKPHRHKGDHGYFDPDGRLWTWGGS